MCGTVWRNCYHSLPGKSLFLQDLEQFPSACLLEHECLRAGTILFCSVSYNTWQTGKRRVSWLSTRSPKCENNTSPVINLQFLSLSDTLQLILAPGICKFGQKMWKLVTVEKMRAPSFSLFSKTQLWITAPWWEEHRISWKQIQALTELFDLQLMFCFCFLSSNNIILSYKQTIFFVLKVSH